MRVLVTGNPGLIGSAVEGKLRATGHSVAGFDLNDGQDNIPGIHHPRSFPRWCNTGP